MMSDADTCPLTFVRTYIPSLGRRYAQSTGGQYAQPTVGLYIQPTGRLVGRSPGLDAGRFNYTSWEMAFSIGSPYTEEHPERIIQRRPPSGRER